MSKARIQLLLLLLSYIVLKMLAVSRRQEKVAKGIEIVKDMTKLFANNMRVYLEIIWESAVAD